MPHTCDSPTKAVACVESGQTVALMHACGEPQALVAALTRRAAELRDVRVLTAWHQVSPAPYAAPRFRDAFIPVTTMPARSTRAAVEEGRGEYLPLKFGEFARAIADERMRIDVALVQVSPPDSHGMCSLGVSLDYARTMLDTATIRVAQVNAHMPTIGGGALIPIDAFDLVCPCDEPLLELTLPMETDVHRAIGRHVAALVPDGAILQVGVGAIPNAALAALAGHKRLGVHSGMLSDGLLDLYDAGMVSRPATDPHARRMVAASIIGTRDLFARSARCDGIEMRPAIHTHARDVIAALRGFVAINSAVEVDLQGNVNAEVADGRRVSGPGGQPEFAEGALLAPEGQSIVALPATARGGKVSRIVAVLSAGAPVTTPAEHVTAVVTEFGCADLRGLEPDRRAEAIARIGHPEFRAELLAAAAEL